MLALLVSFCLSTSGQCENLQDITFSITDSQTIPSKSWKYFYSHYNIASDLITVKVYSNDALLLAQGEGLGCPNSTENAIKKEASQQSADMHIKATSELGVVNFGVYNDGTTDATFYISAQGENPNNFDSTTHSVLIGVFLGLCILLLVLFFVHAILARDKVYYKVEVQE